MISNFTSSRGSITQSLPESHKVSGKHRLGTTTASTSLDTYSTISRETYKGADSKSNILLESDISYHNSSDRPKSLPIPTHNRDIQNNNGELSEYQWTLEIKRLAMLSLIQTVIPGFDDKDDKEFKSGDDYEEYEEYLDNISDFRRSSLWRSRDDDANSHMSVEDSIKLTNSHTPHLEGDLTTGDNLACDYDVSFEADVDLADGSQYPITKAYDTKGENEDQQFTFDDI